MNTWLKVVDNIVLCAVEIGIFWNKYNNNLRV